MMTETTFVLAAFVSMIVAESSRMTPMEHKAPGWHQAVRNNRADSDIPQGFEPAGYSNSG
jgi:hypothetical protein